MKREVRNGAISPRQTIQQDDDGNTIILIADDNGNAIW